MGNAMSPSILTKNQLWTQIAGETSYIAKSAKTSRIQILVFRYIQNVIPHTLFSRGDNTRNTFLRELYLHYAMVNVHYVNILAFLAKQLSRVAKSTMRDIVIEGWLPRSGTHGCCFWWGHQAPDNGTLTMWFRVPFEHGDYLPWWWTIWPNSSLRNGLYLPRRKIRIWVTKNWSYTAGNPSEEESEEDGFPSYEINHAFSVKDRGETQSPYQSEKWEIESISGSLRINAL